MTVSYSRCLTAALLVPLAAAGAAAQEPPRAGAVTLGAAYRAAADADPRVRQLAIEAEQASLRLAVVDATRLPSLRVDGKAQYQSDVASFPFADASGAPVVSPPKATVDASVGVDQRLVDPARASRAAIVRAELDEARARVATAIYALRQEVDEAFFAAALGVARERAIGVRIQALERLRETVDAAVRERALLPSEGWAIEAALLEREQQRQQARSARHAALDRLAALTGGLITRASSLVLADLPLPAAEALDEARARPEYDLYEATRARITAQAGAVGAEARPRVSAFARAGLGRPGLNFISDEFDTYWLGGLQVQWSPPLWGTEARERRALQLERDVVETEAAAFTARLARARTTEFAEAARLEAALALDERIVALRARIEQETRVRWDARVISLAEYLDRSGDLLDAELAREERRIALAAARARVRTTAGLEVQ